jgi:fructose-1,6-bisphosphatase-3
MDDRLVLDKIDYEKGTINIYGKEYTLNDNYFPTIDASDPYKLTPEEEEIVERLQYSFKNSSKLNEHISFLYKKGSAYKVFNSNLLVHACIPLNDDGSFTEVNVNGKNLKGKAYLDYVDELARKAYYTNDKQAKDYMWYLWCGKDSPFFGKDKMTTFEQYFIDDKSAHKENKMPYYKFAHNKEWCEKILAEFGICDEFSHIINGHTPVKCKEGDTPVKADGKLLIIDGGFAKAYREKTGHAGYTLSYNSYGLMLTSNQPLTSIQEVIKHEEDLKGEIVVDDRVLKRKKVEDTDVGKEINEKIKILKMLLEEYKNSTC